MKKRLLSWLLILALCLSLLPAAALAEDAPEQTEAPVVREQTEVPTVQERAESVQTVNDTAAQAAHTNHPICGAAHTDIGDHTGECPAVTWTAWNGVDAIPYDSNNTAYVYLSGDAERTEILTVAAGYKLYLCLNGYSLTKTTKDSNPSFEGVITIYKGAQFTLCDCRGGGKITHEEGVLGRGVRCGDSSSGSRATFAMFGGEISGNHVGSTSGAGQDGAGVEVHNGEFILYGGRIADNHVEKISNDGGGGVYAHGSGSFTMYGGEISGNTSAGDGGGVSAVAASFTMKGGSITNNKAEATNAVGGGAALYNAAFELSGGEISGNRATGNGGGVYYYHYDKSVHLTVSGSVTINGNKNAAGADNNVYLLSGVYMIVTGELKNVIGVTTESVPSASNAVKIAADGGYMTEAMKDHFVYDLAGDCKSVYDSTYRAIYLKVIPHEHPICGATHTDINGHTGECSNVKWTAWDGVSDITYDENNTAYVYLTTNAERTSTLEIAQGNTLYLCLNGHSITKNKSGNSVINIGYQATLNLCDCSDAQTGKLTHGTNNKGEKYDGRGVTVKGTFNMYGGNITGNRASYGGGVTIDKEYSNATFNLYGGSITDNATTGGDGGGGVHALFGTFTMYGGSITGNNAENATYGGGGVYAGSRIGKFYMKGGSITDNTAKNGGGVYVYKSSEFYVSGSVDITGNKNTLGIDENVYLRSGAYFEIDTDGLNADAKIGVTYADTIASGSYVTVAYGANNGYTEDSIFSDKAEPYATRQEGNEVRLYNGLPHEHPICGETDCTDTNHTDVSFRPLTKSGLGAKQSGGAGLTTVTSYYDLSAGSYYLTEDLKTDATIRIADDVKLCLNGHSIIAESDTTCAILIDGDNASLTLCDCRGGSTNAEYGKITTNFKGRGVSLWNGSFTMYGGSIAENGAAKGSNSGYGGAGVCVESGKTFTMYGGEITGNNSNIDNGGGVLVGGTFNLYGGSISGNTAKCGGGVYVKNGTFNVSGGKVADNTASEDGGGVRLDKGAFNMSGSAVISRNTADGFGGGVDANNGTFTMSGGSITGNTTTNESPSMCGGGGVLVYDGGSFTMSGGSITGNNSLRGAGVEVVGSSTMTISGSVQITGNWQNGTLDSTNGSYVQGSRGKANNLYLFTDKTVAIGTAGLNADARIGVTTEVWPESGNPVKVATNAQQQEESYYTAIFTPDAEDSDYKITKKNDNALYLSAHEHTWQYTADDTTDTITAQCSECNWDGGSVTLKAPTGPLTYTGMDQPATLENNLKTGDEAPTIIYTYERNGNSYSIENGGLPKNADTYTASITLGGQSVSVQYTINKADLTVTANPATITYGDPAVSNGVTYSGFVNGENESVLGGELTYIFSYTLGSDTGLYIITPAGKTSGNYDITFTTGTLTVTQREVTLTWHNYENRTYGDGKRVYATAGNLLEADVSKVVVELSGNATDASGTFTATAERLNGYGAHNYKLPTTGLTQKYTIGLAAQTLTFAKTGDQSVTYGETLANPATNKRDDGSAVTYTSSDPNVATVDENGTVTARNVGTATITATAAAVTGKYSEATVSYELTVTPKTLTVNDLELTGSLTKVYDGTDSAANVGAQVKSGVLVGNDTLTITGSARYNSKDVKDANTITFTPDAITTGNYRLTADQTPTVTNGVKITKRVLTVGNVTTAPKTFDGYNNATFYVTNVALNNFANGETLVFYTTEAGGDYGIHDTKFDSANAGARTITGTVALLSTPAAANYTFKDAGGNETTTATFTADGEIVKANARDLGTVQLKQRYTDTDEKEYQPDYAALMPANAGKLTYDVSYEVTKGTASVGKNDKEEATGKLTYQISAQAGAEITWTFTVRSDNYKDSTFKLVVTITDRDKQENFKFKNTTITKTYGDPNFLVAATGATEGSNVSYKGSDDSVAEIAADGTVTIKKAGRVTITATASPTRDYAEGTARCTLIIDPAKLTVTALDKKITVYESAPDLTNPVEGEDYTVTGTLFGADTLTAVTLRYSETPDTSKVGEYIINITATLANYDITTVPGTLTIEPSKSTQRLGILDGTRTVPGGTIETSPKNALPGQTVTITVTPQKGYELGGLTVRDIAGGQLTLTRESDREYTFVMPDSSVSVTGYFVREGETMFRDVPADAYYYEAVQWAVETGVTGGVGDDLFAPDAACTRAQIVTFLWRAAGSPEPQSKADFTDVPANAYYAKAVAWALENGITKGTSATTFSPDDPCTRAQAVTFLARALSAKAEGTADFLDVAESAYYCGAVAWAAENDVTSGVGGKRFAPDQTCTRAQIVTFLYRAYNK